MLRFINAFVSRFRFVLSYRMALLVNLAVCIAAWEPNSTTRTPATNSSYEQLNTTNGQNLVEFGPMLYKQI